jgi:hypothetical protein
MAFSPARPRAEPAGARASAASCAAAVLWVVDAGRRLQPPEHRRFGEEPYATYLPPGQVAALEEIIHHIRETVRHWELRSL